MTDAWKVRHNDAMSKPVGFEKTIVAILGALNDYALTHETRYEAPIGEDSVLGEGFRDILQGLRILLNGDCGRLDCGTLDATICSIAATNDIDIDS